MNKDSLVWCDICKQEKTLGEIGSNELAAGYIFCLKCDLQMSNIDRKIEKINIGTLEFCRKYDVLVDKTKNQAKN